MTTQHPDNNLMLQVRDGDVPKLAVLFERHKNQLFYYFLRLTGDRQLSEDFVQEVFLRVLKYRHTFRGDGQFGIWLYHLARNVQIDYHKKWSRETPLNINETEPAIDEPMPEEHIQHEQNLSLLQTALAKLPIEKREILVLSRYQNLKYDAIAGLLGISVENVKVRVHRAMCDLRKIFLQLSGEQA